MYILTSLFIWGWFLILRIVLFDSPFHNMTFIVLLQSLCFIDGNGINDMEETEITMNVIFNDIYVPRSDDICFNKVL